MLQASTWWAWMAPCTTRSWTGSSTWAWPPLASLYAPSRTFCILEDLTCTQAKHEPCSAAEGCRARVMSLPKSCRGEPFASRHAVLEIDMQGVMCYKPFRKQAHAVSDLSSTMACRLLALEGPLGHAPDFED